jgi:hypothetical protein
VFPINDNDVHQGVIDLQDFQGYIGTQIGNPHRPVLLARCLSPLPFRHDKTRIEGHNASHYGAIVRSGQSALGKTSPNLLQKCGNRRLLRHQVEFLDAGGD